LDTRNDFFTMAAGYVVYQLLGCICFKAYAHFILFYTYCIQTLLQFIIQMLY